DLHMAAVSNRRHEVMKVLTTFATIERDHENGLWTYEFPITNNLTNSLRTSILFRAWAHALTIERLPFISPNS
ncbi:MAG: hypothetical protein ACKVHP_11230, partial [Verrucomicrobiales bacterium]